MAFHAASVVKGVLEKSWETALRELEWENRPRKKGERKSANRLSSHIEPLNRAKDRVESVVAAIQAAAFPGEYPRKLCSDLKSLAGQLSGANESPSPRRIRDAYRKSFESLERILEKANAIATKRPKTKVAAGADKDNKFNILFLSDLHWKGEESRIRWNGVEGHFLDALRGANEDCGGIDLVLFAGDLVFSGERKQFGGKQSVSGFIEKTRKRLEDLGCHAPLLTIPGNHDLQRPSLRGLKDDLPDLAQRVCRSVFGSDRERRGRAASKYRKFVMDAFEQYRKWSENDIETQVTAGILPRGAHKSGMVPGDFSCRIHKNGLRIGVVGLNSSCLQLAGGAFRGLLHVGLRQFDQVLPDPRHEWLRDNDTNILMTHHPVDWLDAESATAFRNEIFDPTLFSLHLHGHMHKEKYTGLSSELGEMQHHFQSPSLFSEISYLDDDGRAVKVRQTGYCVLQFRFKADRMDLRLRPRIFTEKAQEQNPSTFKLYDGWTKRVLVGKRRGGK